LFGLANIYASIWNASIQACWFWHVSGAVNCEMFLLQILENKFEFQGLDIEATKTGQVFKFPDLPRHCLLKMS
jgi:hypothetical protein